MRVITDHKWKQFKYRDEVPPSVLDDQFDWMDEDEGFDGFICYRKHWYHIGDFTRNGEHSPFGDEWCGHHSDTFFSAILIEISDDGEEYRIGLALS